MIDGGDALGAQRVGGDARDERGVDPAREPEHDVLEAVLVARSRAGRARAPRRPPPRGSSSGASDAAGAARRVPRGRGRRGSARAASATSRPRASRAARALARRRAGARRAGARGRRRDQQLLARTARRARSISPVVVDDERVAVEDELVLAADERAERDAREVVARALGEHALALDALAGVVGRGGDVDDQRRAGERLVGGGRAGLPDVLADRQADACAADARCTRPPAPAWK